MNRFAVTALAGCLSVAATGAQAGADLIMASSLPQVHFWVGKHMDLFADAIEERSHGDISFTRFYAGELTSVGRELDALQGGAIDVAAPCSPPITRAPSRSPTSPNCRRSAPAPSPRPRPSWH